MTAAATAVRQRRRTALAHQCASCRRMWALRLVQEGERALAVRCRFCGTGRTVHVPAARRA